MGEERMTAKPEAVELPGFVMSADEAERAAAAAGVETVEDLLPLLIPSAMRRARPPISRFPVGAVGLGESGRVYAGVNLEFLGAPLSQVVHAEQFLIANAAAAGEPALRAIAVSHMPCGHCRQFLQEIRGAAGIRILVTSDAADGCAAEWRSLASLLPRPFGPHDLLPKDAPLVLEPHDNRLGDPVDAVANGFAAGDLEGRLKDAAEAAARAAHAPYSGCPSGFAVADGEGKVYAGGCLESAAYNPTLGPVQTAIIAMIAASGGSAGDVVAAALVEKDGAVAAQEATARVFLAAVAPQASFHVYKYRSPDV
ncbi:cytidine deaminase 1 [Aegilops tauschii subsp. strangulata]|uniref:cytidine deaminase n=2 Tax=Triticinae TaxID=1648030 RepID=A0A3B6GU34_WHEAT|nr:LOW QUALITY PROTEIN: cytidine deaminase 1 [Aegilops tauschii subsp. strangulata]XP_044357381.1 cytidine deaminase 1-like [Triticum aestivum]